MGTVVQFARGGDDPDDRFRELPWAFRSRIRIEEATGHWLWLGSIKAVNYQASNGYGQYRPPGQERVTTHRYVWEQLVGPIPAGLVIDHCCLETLCCRPSHLEPVTIGENNRRRNPGYRANAGGACQPIIPRGDLEPHTYHQPTLFDPPPPPRLFPLEPEPPW